MLDDTTNHSWEQDITQMCIDGAGLSPSIQASYIVSYVRRLIEERDASLREKVEGLRVESLTRKGKESAFMEIRNETLDEVLALLPQKPELPEKKEHI